MANLIEQAMLSSNQSISDLIKDQINLDYSHQQIASDGTIRVNDGKIEIAEDKISQQDSLAFQGTIFQHNVSGGTVKTEINNYVGGNASVQNQNGTIVINDSTDIPSESKQYNSDDTTKSSNIEQQIGISTDKNSHIVVSVDSTDKHGVSDIQSENSQLENQDKKIVETVSSTSETKTIPEKPEPKVIDNTPTALTVSGFLTINELKKEIEKNNEEQQNKWENNVDRNRIVESNKKVSLNVAPINKSINISNYMSEDEWGSRLSYILGDDTSKLLYSHFKDTMGLVFPYTPDIDFNHTINYEETDILHSNLAVQHYKNTPPPTISLKADFTADTPKNGEYMYAVIHFLRSISKCEFGETVAAYSSITGSGSGNREAVPPPILYLNGWGNLIDNIPVVIKSFGISLGKDKHYVNVAKYNVWLPTDITISIQMAIQFNLDMYKHLFDLNDYKNMVLFGKTSSVTKGEGENKTTTYRKLNNIVRLETFGVTNAETNKGVQATLYKTSTTRRYNGSGWTW